MPRYRVTIDRDACDGIFACLTRDERFVEDAEGLATFDAADATMRTDEDGTRIVAEFEDDRLADAEGAAAACPPGAIDVEVLSS
ncbi:ferredoxin [Halorientalis marina]|jgi:ferredoxin|uniref:ferredoxin n=1 Tax=Halorientalis marina TaxID=2931976 RepID=UPI001FF1A536|nr:ferredoxin [Halorientalis marina]